MSEAIPTYGCHYCDELEQDCGRHGISPWIPADKELPGNPRCVLATDGECHFVACHEAHGMDFHGKDCDWVNAHTSEAIDSHITHWMELPEVPQ
jgi:hypothetical protein